MDPLFEFPRAERDGRFGSGPPQRWDGGVETGRARHTRLACFAATVQSGRQFMPRRNEITISRTTTPPPLQPFSNSPSVAHTQTIAMITISESSPVESGPASPLALDRPRQFRLRTSSESIGDARQRQTQEDAEDALLLERSIVQRSASCSAVYAQRRELQRAQFEEELQCHRVKLRCRDEALCVRSKANVLSLVETVQKHNASSSTSVLLAKKALKYRRLLDRAQEVDLNDPAFDVGEFMSDKRSGRTELVGFHKPTQAP